MNRKEKLDNMLCEKNGVLQTADVIRARDVTIYGYCKSRIPCKKHERAEGHLVKAYNAERTVCDLLCSRSNVEIQDLQSAMKEYLRSKEKNLPQLMRYAKEFRVEKILRPYLEVLL